MLSLESFKESGFILDSSLKITLQCICITFSKNFFSQHHFLERWHTRHIRTHINTHRCSFCTPGHPEGSIQGARGLSHWDGCQDDPWPLYCDSSVYVPSFSILLISLYIYILDVFLNKIKYTVLCMPLLFNNCFIH